LRQDSAASTGRDPEAIIALIAVISLGSTGKSVKHHNNIGAQPQRLAIARLLYPPVAEVDLVRECLQSSLELSSTV